MNVRGVEWGWGEGWGVGGWKSVGVVLMDELASSLPMFLSFRFVLLDFL